MQTTGWDLQVGLDTWTPKWAMFVDGTFHNPGNPGARPPLLLKRQRNKMELITGTDLNPNPDFAFVMPVSSALWTSSSAKGER